MIRLAIRLYRLLPAWAKTPCPLQPSCSAYALQHGIRAAMQRGIDETPFDQCW